MIKPPIMGIVIREIEEIYRLIIIHCRDKACENCLLDICVSECVKLHINYIECILKGFR